MNDLAREIAEDIKTWARLGYPNDAERQEFANGILAKLAEANKERDERDAEVRKMIEFVLNGTVADHGYPAPNLITKESCQALQDARILLGGDDG